MEILLLLLKIGLRINKFNFGTKTQKIMANETTNKNGPACACG
jgi:hypothetical protein